jgi:thymidylate kinase
MFIMIDGIDGSGKSTIVSAWKKYLTDQGKSIFDLKNFIKENDRYPEPSEFSGCDFIFSAEPTYTGIGKVLREELINNKNNYSAEAIAQAHSLDRLVLYTKVLIPLLNEGKTIIQDRGLSTSLVYQPVQDSRLTLETVAVLPGNRLAAQYRPDHLILMSIQPEIAFNRLTSRTDKQDDAIFEKIDFLKKSSEKYHEEKYSTFFKNLGTQLHYLSGEEKIDIMNKQSVDLLKAILK